MSTRLPIVALAVALLAGCNNDTVGAPTAEDAIEITNKIWEEDLPQVELENLVIAARDLHDRWRVTYEPPRGSLGARWVLDVDKRTGQVTVVSGGQ